MTIRGKRELSRQVAQWTGNVRPKVPPKKKKKSNASGLLTTQYPQADEPKYLETVLLSTFNHPSAYFGQIRLPQSTLPRTSPPPESLVVRGPIILGHGMSDRQLAKKLRNLLLLQLTDYKQTFILITAASDSTVSQIILFSHTASPRRHRSVLIFDYFFRTLILS